MADDISRPPGGCVKDSEIPTELRVLYVRDMAKLRRVSVSAARAWLAALEARSDGDLVHRVGNRLCITERAYASVLSGGGPEPSLRREVLLLRREVQRLASRLRRVEAQQDPTRSRQSTRIENE
jgi:hypothetical protein